MANLQQLIQSAVAGKLTPKEFNQLPPEIRQVLAQLMVQSSTPQQKPALPSPAEVRKTAYNVAKSAQVGSFVGELKVLGYCSIVLIILAFLFAAWLYIGTHAIP